MRVTNIGHIVENANFNRFHLSILCWCMLIIIFDGYDLVVYGSVVPILMKNWNISAFQAGAIGSYALFGMAFGALVFGPAADKVGRKRVILFCVFVFSFFMIVAGFANGPGTLGICRFLTGLGLGGVMPNVIALTSEYSPKLLRGRMISIMMGGYSIGGMLAAGLSIVFLPSFGWPSVFWFAGLPILMIPFMYRYLPDTLGSYMAQNNAPKVKEVLSQIEPSYIPVNNEQLILDAPKKNTFPVVTLFSEGRVFTTIMFWIAFFMSLLMIYGLNTWLPKLMLQAGFQLGSSLSFLLVLNVGATVGAVLMGWFADLWGARIVLITFYTFATITILLLGFIHNQAILYLLVAIAGAATIGTQNIANAYASQYYPIWMRSTGLGWALGIGRFGGIAGPTLGGILLAMNTSLQFNFLAFAIPGVIAAFVIYLTKPVAVPDQISTETGFSNPINGA